MATVCVTTTRTAQSSEVAPPSQVHVPGPAGGWGAETVGDLGNKRPMWTCFFLIQAPPSENDQMLVTVFRAYSQQKESGWKTSGFSDRAPGEVPVEGLYFGPHGSTEARRVCVPAAEWQDRNSGRRIIRRPQLT